MWLSLRSLIKLTGTSLIIMGIAFLSPLSIALIYGEYWIIKAFIFPILCCLIIGGLCLLGIRNYPQEISLRNGLLTVALSWIICTIMGSLPYLLSGVLSTPSDAIFESASGFSTTGATIFKDIEILPKSILFWRALTNWLGGMGILGFAIAILPSLGVSGQTMATFETTGPTISKVKPKMRDTAKRLYSIYIFLTITESLLLMFVGLNTFDSICHSFATIGTGGFSNYNESIGHFNSIYVEIIIGFFMLAASINFNLYFIMLRNGFKSIFKNGELKFYTRLIIIFSFLISINMTLSLGGNFLDRFRDALFQVISIISTTGFVSTSYSHWTTFGISMLFILLLIGGCSFSTSGGIKVIRFLVVIKMIKRTIALILHPNAIVNIKVGDKLLTSEISSNIANFIIAYIGIFLLGGFAISLDGFDIFSSLSVSASCIGNVGPTLGEIGYSSNMSLLSSTSKFIMSFIMIAGRLEIFPILMLFSRKFWNTNNY